MKKRKKNTPNEKMKQKYNFEDKLKEIEEKSYLVYNLLYSSKDLQNRVDYFWLIDEFINEEINLDKDKKEKV